MNKIKGYEITEEIQVSSKKIIYRGLRQSDHQSVIIKILKTEHPSLEEISTLKHEYQITANLELPGIIKAYSLEKYHHSFALILEDIGGESLHDWMNSGTKEKITSQEVNSTLSVAASIPFLHRRASLLTNHHFSTAAISSSILAHHSLQKFFSIAIQIAQSLAEIHEHQIIHKDIKPSNIIINSETGKVKISDFSIATRLAKEIPQPDHHSGLAGTIAYMSPEQTGRMNRSLDYRTDFYSLGVTFYEILTGKLPFVTDDPLELIHFHLAVSPLSPHQFNPEIPEAVSTIVMKLLAKNAEDRYQSAWGLKADLEICLKQLIAGHLSLIPGKQQRFIPGSLDKSGQFLIPQKLYGRSQEVDTLLAAFTRVAQKDEQKVPSEIVLVSGYSGIGKTSVINEIHKPIVQQRGYFIGGKFDQLQRNVPYAAIIQALRSLINQILIQPREEIAAWQEKLLAKLGENGQIIVDVLPEIELIIGSQPEVPQLEPTASQNRFNRVFKQFISTFTQKEHPLVLFLDDLQWSDSASLQLIEQLITDHDTQYLLLIGAYRDNEVSPTHPLIHTVEKIQQQGTPINNIVLNSLAFEHINQLIADTVGETTEQVKSLAELLFHKTGGNPFFLTQILQTLHGEKLLTFNYTQGKWQWDIAEIQAVGIADFNVVELVARNLQKLPPSTQEVLKLAACIGNQFSLGILALINQKFQSDTAADLWSALQAGLILPLSNSYKLPLLFDAESIENIDLGLDNNKTSYTKVVYRFLHDRVQQAAYSLIPDLQKQGTHLRIGQLLLENTPSEEIEEHIFDIVNQLNVGADQLTEQSKQEELARLNLLAGKKAKEASAYEAVLKYLNVGMGLLPELSWQSHYELTYDFHIELLEVTYIRAEFEQAQQLSQTILTEAKTLLEKVRVYEQQISYYFTQNQIQAALDKGLEILKMLSIKLPSNPNNLNIMLSLVYTKLTQGRRKIEDLASLPEMTDPIKLAAMKILMAIVPAAFVAKPELFPLVILKMVSLSLKYGNAPISCFGYSCYGTVHCAKLSDFDQGNQYGQLALKLREQFNVKELKSRVYLVFNVFIRHWKNNLRVTLESLVEGINSGQETGDVENTCHCAAFYCNYLFLSGESLDSVQHKQAQYLPMVEKYQQEFDVFHLSLWGQVVDNLLANSNDLCTLNGNKFQEDKEIPKLLEASNKLVLFATYLGKIFLCFYFKDYGQSLELCVRTEKYLEAVLGTAYVPIYIFYYSLTLLALYPNVSPQVQKEHLQKIVKYQNKMKKWANHCPANYLHKYNLVEAEKARVLGHHQQAAEFYDRGIKGARDSGYVQEEALANELAAEFYFSYDREKLARMYISEAYYGYIRWGATAKVEDLHSRYPEFFSQLITQDKSEVDVTVTRTTTLTMSRGGSLELALDLATVMKAYQAISQEIVLEKLLDKLMQIMMENAGAQTGVMLLRPSSESNHHEGDLILAAKGIVEPKKMVELPFLPISVSDCSELPLSIINYVCSTKSSVVIREALTEELFSHDSYIIKYQPQSILSLPIIYQGKLTAILYLENRSIQGAFTKERLELLSLLSTQAAISIENALLYSSLESKVAARTEELNQKNLYLNQTLEQLQKTQLQLIQSEKMSSLGQLVGGIAHEINNPVNFIYANLNYTDNYTRDLLELIELYKQNYGEQNSQIQEKIEEIDLEFLTEDLPKIIHSLKSGATRIETIVKSLRNFSRLDESELKSVDIHEGIDNSLLIIQNRLKSKSGHDRIEICKEYGELSPVECYASELNQVFMHIFNNAIDAIEESWAQETSPEQLKQKQGKIQIYTQLLNREYVLIRIIDNGIGMNKDVQNKLFDPFFTTKPVGKGTGMGMAISYQVVVDKHKGKLNCHSILGEGTELEIQIPVMVRENS